MSEVGTDPTQLRRSSPSSIHDGVTSIHVTRPGGVGGGSSATPTRFHPRSLKSPPVVPKADEDL